MTDPEYEVSLIRTGVDDIVIPDLKSVQADELARERLPLMPLGGQHSLNLPENTPRCRLA